DFDFRAGPVERRVALDFDDVGDGRRHPELALGDERGERVDHAGPRRALPSFLRGAARRAANRRSYGARLRGAAQGPGACARADSEQEREPRSRSVEPQRTPEARAVRGPVAHLQITSAFAIVAP